MTLKEMLNKLNTYNEIAALTGNHQKLGLGIAIEDPDDSAYFTDYEALKKWLEENYIKPAATAILKNDGYEFNWTKATQIEYTVKHGGYTSEKTTTVRTWITE